jgi:hypothetical protein
VKQVIYVTDVRYQADVARCRREAYGDGRTDVDLDDLLDLEVRRLRSTSRRQVVARFSPVRVRGEYADSLRCSAT